MTDPMQWNDPRRLFQLFMELTGEDLINPEKQGKEVLRK